jgi:tetratricopeptide (TPR) repeat protein
MLRNALFSAQVRLDLGRYREVDEPLGVVEKAADAGSPTALGALLLRLKLTLRRNAYAALWTYAQMLFRNYSENTEAQIEGELVVNAALRDLFDTERLQDSVRKLLAFRGQADFTQQNAIDRSLARAFAKLGDSESALKHARTATDASARLDSPRAVGNSQLALAEALRYRREFDHAIEAYRQAAQVARGIENRDSLLWSLLGETAAQIERGQLAGAVPILDELDALLAEPGYDHPLEAAHTALLRALSGGAQAHVLERYRSIGIEWPERYLNHFNETHELQGSIPL